MRRENFKSKLIMVTSLVRFIGVSTVACSTAFTWAGDTPQHKTVNDIDIHYGVVPIEVVQSHVKQHGEERMHGKRRPAYGTHHLVVTLYDAKTAQRITDATVTATVIPLGLSHEKRPLQVMKINNVVSYGNYFNMPAGETPYRIQIDINRPSTHTTVSAEFEYRHSTGR